MQAAPTPLPPGARLQRNPLAVIAVPLAPIALEGRYRLLIGALWRLGPVLVEGVLSHFRQKATPWRGSFLNALPAWQIEAP